MAATDESRLNDLDGRGNLSALRLFEVSEFFLSTALDQVEFISDSLDTENFSNRLKAFIEYDSSRNSTKFESFFLLREAFLRGQIPRGEAPRILGKPERTARRLIADLIKKEYLISDSSKSPLKFNFAIPMIPYILPKLYPESIELEMKIEKAGP